MALKSNRRRLLAFGVAGVLAPSWALAGTDSFWLVPRTQLLGDDLASEPPAADAVDPAAPQIIIDSPVGAAGALRSPLNIVVRFQPGPGVAIDPASFKVQARILGGWLDVTGEIRKHAQIRNGGVQAPGAMLPAGNHRIRLQVADTKGRTGMAEVAFRVS